MYIFGAWETNGENVTKDPVDGLALIQKAANKNHGPAMFEVALRQIQAKPSPAELQKTLETVQEAAVLGSTQAQLYLGDRYETGKDVSIDLERAKRYFRLCASKGVAQCQYRFARLLLEPADAPEHDFVLAIAWLQLAAEQGVQEAKDALVKEGSQLTPSQTTWVKTLKARLGPQSTQ